MCIPAHAGVNSYLWRSWTRRPRPRCYCFECVPSVGSTNASSSQAKGQLAYIVVVYADYDVVIKLMIHCATNCAVAYVYAYTRLDFIQEVMQNRLK